MIDGAGLQWIDGGCHRQKSSQLDGQMSMFSGETFLKRGLAGKDDDNLDDTTTRVAHTVLYGPRRESEDSFEEGGG